MITILGAGAFGTALAVSWSQAQKVTLWSRRLPEDRRSPRLPDVQIPEQVMLTDDLASALSDTVVLALPAQSLRGFLTENAALLNGRRLVSTAKGIDLMTAESPSGLILKSCPDASVATLTGPSFAADIARGLPTALTLACADEGAVALQHLLSTPSLRLYRTDDLRGAELGGALKNVIAIAAGVSIGAGFGDSARAALITRGFAEMTRLATDMGARAETLAGLSGLGDLVLTATSGLSRNFRYGYALGAGETFDETVTVEGAKTAQAVSAIAAGRGIATPIADAVAALAEGRASVADSVLELLRRPLKEE
ncbi:NAD(P)H-dependent glycerol-3-phosphate dehydrogenase [Paracoccus aerodenitrificans]|uniref:NAD(P)H-dependent glycerol-3-phosphate dehydrogenase n=1 Tax=Paracoccus aerodenitrificans TaxID=3017781 RepID=UPI0022F00AFA|nr:NAD(P)H-dependent glycerol-3-phosphate dehydrogenase [Paracoccus aerodenitrificans]WBU64525.1 NAD(P)-dependent glycerol-3-phosphate dehydrogenase [Paracoccus aerodenitrificans]